MLDNRGIWKSPVSRRVYSPICSSRGGWASACPDSYTSIARQEGRRRSQPPTTLCLPTSNTPTPLHESGAKIVVIETKAASLLCSRHCALNVPANPYIYRCTTPLGSKLSSLIQAWRAGTKSDVRQLDHLSRNLKRGEASELPVANGVGGGARSWPGPMLDS